MIPDHIALTCFDINLKSTKISLLHKKPNKMNALSKKLKLLAIIGCDKNWSGFANINRAGKTKATLKVSRIVPIRIKMNIRKNLNLKNQTRIKIRL